MSDEAKDPLVLHIDSTLLDDARAHDVDLVRATEEGLRRALRRAHADRWRRENADAIRAANAWVEANGLPLERYRMF